MNRLQALGAIALLSAAAGSCPAQELDVASDTADPASRLLRVAAEDAPALEVLTRAAAALSVPLRIDRDVLDVVERGRLTVRRDRIVLDELALLVGLRLSLLVSVQDGELRVSGAAAPGEAARAHALGHLDHALVAHPDPGLMPYLRYHRACILLESGAAPAAALAFEDLAREYPAHEVARDARMLSIAAALRAGQHREALATLAAVEESRGGIGAVPGAELLPARVHAAAGNLDEALLRARRVAATGRFARDRALAGLVAAEIRHDLGDGAGMIAELDRLPDGFERTCRDLAPKAALARGLGLMLAGDRHAALAHLRVAFRTIADDARAGVASSLSDCLAALDEPVPAWLVLRQAEDLEKDADEVRRIQVRRAELEEAFGAVGRALETCTAILDSASGRFREAERVLATLARCLITTNQADDARAALELLSDRESWRGWALFQLALLERRGGDREAALRALARIEGTSLAPPGPAADEVRTLRGELLLEMGDPLQAAEVFRGTREEAGR